MEILASVIVRYRQWRRAALAGLAASLVGGVLVGAAPAGAQDQGVSGELEALLVTIEDEAQRKALAASIRALIEARREMAAEARVDSLGARTIAILSARTREIADQLGAAGEAVSDVPVLLGWFRTQVVDGDARALWVGLLVKLVLILAAGLVAERACGAVLARPRRDLENRSGDRVVVRVPVVLARTFFDTVPLAAFVAASYAMVLLVQPDSRVRVVSLTVTQAYVIMRAVMVLTRMILAPAATTLRVLPIGDETAVYLFVWTRRLAVVAVFGYFLAEAALLLGLPGGGYVGLLRLIGLAIAAMVVVFILQNRAGIAAWIRGPGTTANGRFAMQSLRDRFADVWHVLAVIYVVGVFGVSALGIEGGFAFLFRATVVSAVILVVAWLATIGLRSAVDRGFAIGPEFGARFPGLEARANRYLSVLHGVLRTAIVIFATIALLGAWGLDAFAWLDTPLGGHVMRSALSIAAVLVVALIVWEAMSSAVERYLSATDAEGGPIERSARARTLLPLLRNAVFVVLAVMVTLIVLSELGVDIAPLLAGAGVVGLAVGFGSQKLVQDVITGAFILFEDSIAVGDVVRAGGHAGLVEALSIRSIRMRDLSGSVHTIPFSAVDTVTNLTKEFSYYVMEVAVAYREDTDQVTKILRDILDEMRDDPDYGPLIMEPLDVLGLDSFAESAVVIKARIKTEPIKQWTVGREFNRRMKMRFDEAGVEIPFPHRTLYFGEDKEGLAPPARVAMEEASRRAERTPASKVGAEPKGGST